MRTLTVLTISLSFLGTAFAAPPARKPQDRTVQFTDKIGPIAFSPDGKQLAVGREGAVDISLVESRNMKTLRANPIAERELRLFGKYRILFSVDEGAEEVTIITVGEKRGNSLFVQGKEFIDPESDTTE